MRTSVVFAIALTLTVPSPPAPAADDKTTVVLESIGVFAGMYLVEAHDKIGVIADSLSKNLYPPEALERGLASTVTRLKLVDGKFAVLLEKAGLAEADQAMVKLGREVIAAELRSIEAMRAFVKGKDEAEAKRYEAARKEAWAGIRKFTQMDKKPDAPTAGPGGAAAASAAAAAAFRADLCEVLAKLDPDTKDLKAAETELRQELAAVVDKHAAALRPAKGTATYSSRDGAILVVIGANGAAGSNGAAVTAKSDSARLVVAVAGDGGPAAAGRAGTGGFAVAKAPAGVAVALGGRGG